MFIVIIRVYPHRPTNLYLHLLFHFSSSSSSQCSPVRCRIWFLPPSIWFLPSSVCVRVCARARVIATKSVIYLKWEANAQADVESKVQAVSQKYLAPLCLARPPAAARDAVLVQIPACYSVCRTRPVPQDVLPGRDVQAKGDAGQGTVR